jgi:hypothetical protein
MKLKWLAPVVFPAVAVALVAVPLLVDQPFGTQTPRTIWLAYTLRRWSPTLTWGVLVAMLVLTVRLGRGSRWWTKTLLAIALTVTAGATWFAWQNPFEWMFNALPRPRFVAGGEARFVEPRDLVLAVSVDGDAAAYPIRQMAYHHLVNDRIGRTPAVVTY